MHFISISEDTSSVFVSSPHLLLFLGLTGLLFFPFFWYQHYTYKSNIFINSSIYKSSLSPITNLHLHLHLRRRSLCCFCFCYLFSLLSTLSISLVFHYHQLHRFWPVSLWFGFFFHKLNKLIQFTHTYTYAYPYMFTFHPYVFTSYQPINLLSFILSLFIFHTKISLNPSRDS